MATRQLLSRKTLIQNRPTNNISSRPSETKETTTVKIQPTKTVKIDDPTTIRLREINNKLEKIRRLGKRGYESKNLDHHYMKLKAEEKFLKKDANYIKIEQKINESDILKQLNTNTRNLVKGLKKTNPAQYDKVMKGEEVTLNLGAPYKQLT